MKTELDIEPKRLSRISEFNDSIDGSGFIPDWQKKVEIDWILEQVNGDRRHRHYFKFIGNNQYKCLICKKVVTS